MDLDVKSTGDFVNITLDGLIEAGNTMEKIVIENIRRQLNEDKFTEKLTENG